MTPKEIDKKRRDLEGYLYTLLRDFEEETGVKVRNAEAEFLDFMSPEDSYPKRRLNNVRIELAIERCRE